MKKEASIGEIYVVVIPDGVLKVPYEELTEYCALPRTVCESLWDSPLTPIERGQVLEAVLLHHFYGHDVPLDDKLMSRAQRFTTVLDPKRVKAKNSKGASSDTKPANPTKPARGKGKESEKVDTDTGEVKEPERTNAPDIPPGYVRDSVTGKPRNIQTGMFKDPE